MPIRLITFDLDDTLWEMTPVLVEAERRVRAWLETHAPRMAREWDREALATLRAELLETQPGLAHQFSRMRVVVLREALLRSGHSPGQADALSREAFEVFLEARHEVRLFEDVLPVLDSLGRRYVLGALSNGNADVRRLGLDRHFRFHFSAESHGTPKPDPAMFRAALAWADVRADEAVHVGDHPEHDVAGAVGAGLHAVLLHARDTPAPQRGQFATIRRLAELVDVIEQAERTPPGT